MQTSFLNPFGQLLHKITLRLKVAEIEEPFLEAQLLLCLVLDVSRASVLAGTPPMPNPEQQLVLEKLLQQREQHVPFAYLRGNQEFYGLLFHVTPAVLIPRPETELLVDFGRERLSSHPEARFVDVGTGSGCIPISLLKYLPNARAVAIDISPDALAIAKQNAESHGVQDRLLFVQTHLLTGVQEEFDLILSNPPYIPTEEIATLQPEVRDHEPRLALDGGEDGLMLIRELLCQSHRNLRSGGWIALEVAQGQAPLLLNLLRENGFQSIEARHDLAGIARLVAGQRP